MEVYRSPVLFMRGRGLGNFLGRLVRGVIPFLSAHRGVIKTGLKKVGKAATRAALQAASDSITTNRSFKDNLKRAGKQELKQLMRNVKKRKAMGGKGRKRRKHSASIKKQHRSRKRSVSKKPSRGRGLDVFDYYRSSR